MQLDDQTKTTTITHTFTQNQTIQKQNNSFAAGKQFEAIIALTNYVFTDGNCIKKIRFFSSSHSTIKLCHQSSVPLVSHPTKFVSYPSKVSVHVNLLLAEGVILSKFHKQLSAFLKKAVSNKLNSLFIFLEIVKVFIIKTSTPFQMQSVIGVNVLQCPQTKSS